MSPTKNTTVRSVRIPDDISEWINRRAKRKKLSFSAWANWAFKVALRSHKGR
uniref:Uncharacterized protein n=1 Tax=viral metagenome TaxID=1070528 RepID=A0A6M3J7U2_9ZZZZ